MLLKTTLDLREEERRMTCCNEKQALTLSQIKLESASTYVQHQQHHRLCGVTISCGIQKLRLSDEANVKKVR